MPRPSSSLTILYFSNTVVTSSHSQTTLPSPLSAQPKGHLDLLSLLTMSSSAAAGQQQQRAHMRRWRGTACGPWWPQCVARSSSQALSPRTRSKTRKQTYAVAVHYGTRHIVETHCDNVLGGVWDYPTLDRLKRCVYIHLFIITNIWFSKPWRAATLPFASASAKPTGLHDWGGSGVVAFRDNYS